MNTSVRKLTPLLFLARNSVQLRVKTIDRAVGRCSGGRDARFEVMVLACISLTHLPNALAVSEMTFQKKNKSITVLKTEKAVTGTPEFIL
jgi:hypothetical protein